MSDEVSPFVCDVTQVLLARRRAEKPIASAGEAWAWLAALVLKLREILDRDVEMRRSEFVREMLVSLAAAAWQSAVDLGIESRGDAIGKDIPF